MLSRLASYIRIPQFPRWLRHSTESAKSADPPVAPSTDATQPKRKVLILDSTTQAEPQPIREDARSVEQQPVDPNSELSLTDLPDVFLVNVFANLSILDQLRLGSTCTRMRSLQEKAFHDRQSLSLLKGFDSLCLVSKCHCKLLGEVCDDDEIRSRSYFSQLSLEQFQSDTVKWIARSFPHITELSLVLESPSLSEISHTIFLLIKLRPSLTTLKLYISIGRFHGMAFNQTVAIKPKQNINSEDLSFLLQTLNYCLPNLKSLTLFVQGWLTSYQSTSRIFLPILSQLEEFNFNSWDEPACLVDSLRHYALPNKQLTYRIGCRTEGDVSLRIDPNLTSYFTSLDIDGSSVFQILAHFTSLTSVNVDDCDDYPPYDDLLEALAQLKQLTWLSLNSYAAEALDPNSCNALPVLPSVKMFDTEIVYDAHVDLCKLFQIKQCFPGLESIKIFFHCDKCNDCGYFEKLTVEQLQHCAKLWTRSLRKLPIGLMEFEFIVDELIGEPDYSSVVLTYKQPKAI